MEGREGRREGRKARGGGTRPGVRAWYRRELRRAGPRTYAHAHARTGTAEVLSLSYALSLSRHAERSSARSVRWGRLLVRSVFEHRTRARVRVCLSVSDLSLMRRARRSAVAL